MKPDAVEICSCATLFHSTTLLGLSGRRTHGAARQNGGECRLGWMGLSGLSPGRAPMPKAKRHTVIGAERSWPTGSPPTAMFETVRSHVAHSAQGLPPPVQRMAAMTQFLAFATMETAMVPRPRPSLDPRIADEAPTAQELTNYDDYLNGQPVSCCAQRIKPGTSAGILPHCCDETVFGACNPGGCHGAAA